MTNGRLVNGIFPSKSLNWVMRRTPEQTVFPPAACSVGGELFQICGFENENNDYYVIDTETLPNALNLSVSVYGITTLNTVELACLTAVCDRQKIKHEQIEAFTHHNIKGRQSFDTLRAVNGFCPVLKRYLSLKDVPLKTIAVFDKLKNDCRRYVKNTVEDRDISVGDFRKLVNLLFDMQSQAEAADFNGDVIKNLTAKQDATRISFMKQFHDLTSGFPMSVQSADNFETGRLTVSFTLENSEQFEKILSGAAEKKETIGNIFRFFDEQNIS